jgi:hypothetical protein
MRRSAAAQRQAEYRERHGEDYKQRHAEYMRAWRRGQAGKANERSAPPVAGE